MPPSQSAREVASQSSHFMSYARAAAMKPSAPALSPAPYKPFAMSKSQRSSPPSPAAAGLVNGDGKNNCFLNSVLQCLWHCAPFKGTLLAHRGVVSAQHHPIPHALLCVFEAMAAQAPAVDPVALRTALAELPGGRFGMGAMADPGDVLLELQRCLTDVPGLGAVVNDAFGLRVSIATVCTGCQRRCCCVDAHYEQHVYAPVDALLAHAACHPQKRLADVIRAISPERKTCDACGTVNDAHRLLSSAPAALTLLLAWKPCDAYGSTDARREAIAQVMRLVTPSLSVCDVFGASNVAVGLHARARYNLASLICSYGNHYMALVRQAAGSFVLYDDHKVSPVGDWQAVSAKFQKGLIQPVMLFYLAQ
jgi:hypothetical protein